MKRILILFLVLLLVLLGGCDYGRDELKEQLIKKLDPWTTLDTLEQAEELAGFSLDMSEKIGAFEAVSFRAIKDKRLEAIYTNGTREVTVCKFRGDDMDLSWYLGEYEFKESFERDGGTLEYKYLENKGLLIRIKLDSYYYHISAYSGFPGRSCRNFLDEVFK